MRYSLLLVIILNWLSSSAQVTFEKTYPFTSAYAIKEIPGQSFIGCGDSSQSGLIYGIDRFGNLNGTFFPSLRGNKVSVMDIELDPNSGGFAICGASEDTSGNTYTGYYLLMNGMAQNTDSIFYNGGIDGPTADIVLRTSNNDFIVAAEAWYGAGTNQSRAHKVNYPGTDGWSTLFGSNHSLNSMFLTESDNLLTASFGWTAAASAGLHKYDTAGNSLHNFSITDTAYGGSLIFQSVTGASADGNYMFGVNVSPNVGPNSVVYLAKLDTALNVVWQKYLDWGFSVDITAITKTSDSCIVLLLSTANGMALHKLNSAGDSLWTQFHNRSTSGYGNRFMECSDHGFIIAGTFTDTISHGYILKTDSLGRYLPDPTLDVSGPLEFCAGDTTVISALPGYSYLWSTGDTTQSLYVVATGDYFVTLTDSFGGQINSDTINILVHIPVQPTLTVNGDTLTSSAADAYQWYLDGMPIVGETTPTYVAMVNGIYQVETFDSFGCSSLSEADTLTTVGISKPDDLNSKAILFPNPASTESILSVTTLVNGIFKVTLTNSIGQIKNVVYENRISANESLRIPVSAESLEKGVYILKLENENKSAYLKLLIMK